MILANILKGSPQMTLTTNYSSYYEVRTLDNKLIIIKSALLVGKDDSLLYAWEPQENRAASGWIAISAHSTTGPAVVGRGIHPQYFLGGQNVTREEWERQVAEVKSMPLELRLTDPREWVRDLRMGPEILEQINLY